MSLLSTDRGILHAKCPILPGEELAREGNEEGEEKD